MKTVHLTPSEAEVINHRAEIPDCMADAFHPEMGDGNPWGLTDHDDIQEKICETMAEIMTDGTRGEMTITFNPCNQGHVAVLRDLVEGSTWSAVTADLLEFDHATAENAQGRRQRAKLRSIEAKFADAGLEVSFPYA